MAVIGRRRAICTYIVQDSAQVCGHGARAAGAVGAVVLALLLADDVEDFPVAEDGG